MLVDLGRLIEFIEGANIKDIVLRQQATYQEIQKWVEQHHLIAAPLKAAKTALSGTISWKIPRSSDRGPIEGITPSLARACLCPLFNASRRLNVPGVVAEAWRI
jgi:hypothetical protein